MRRRRSQHPKSADRQDLQSQHNALRATNRNRLERQATTLKVVLGALREHQE